MNISIMYRIATILSLIILLASCRTDSGSSEFVAKPTALGKMDEIVVICDDDIWEGMVGDSIRYYFESAYPVMPSPEPIFDLRHFTPVELTHEPLRKELRTYLIVADLSDQDSPTAAMVRKDLGEERTRSILENGNATSTVGKDKWAKGQMVAYLFANNDQTLASEVAKKFSTIANRVTTHDQKQLEASIYAVRRINEGLANELLSERNLAIDIPNDYTTVIDNDSTDLLWLRKDSKEAALNIVFQRFPYSNPSQLDKNNIIQDIDAFGKQYVTSSTEGSYLVINDRDLPVNVYQLDLGGRYAVEYRGIWEMTKDFYGGPFASYAILDEDQKNFNLITTFVLAPGKKKRDFMKQLDYIVKKNYLAAAKN